MGKEMNMEDFFKETFSEQFLKECEQEYQETRSNIMQSGSITIKCPRCGNDALCSTSKGIYCKRCVKGATLSKVGV